jgi:hypothetical protein
MGSNDRQQRCNPIGRTCCLDRVQDYAHHMDSLQERVDDARLLWDARRREGAFLMALLAVAARARQEHPRLIGDRDAFERFIESRFRPRISVEFRGELHSVLGYAMSRRRSTAPSARYSRL